MNEPKDLKRGDPVGRNWTTINELSATVRRLEAQVSKLEGTVTELRLRTRFRDNSESETDARWV